MKTRVFLLSLFPLLSIFVAVANADPVFPLPVYHITSTSAGVVTDIPNAIVTEIHPGNWAVHVPNHGFYRSGGSGPHIYLRDPDSTQVFNLISIAFLPGHSLYWNERSPINPFEQPLSDSALAMLAKDGSADPVADVWLQDLPDAVPDQRSTLYLLVMALVGTGGLRAWRRFERAV